LSADSKPVKQEVKSTVILPPFSIPCAKRHAEEEYYPYHSLKRVLSQQMWWLY